MLNTRILRKIIVYLIYVTAFVPLIIFSQFISPFHFGKVVIFRSIVEIMAVFYLILAIKDSNYRPKFHPLLLVFGLLTAAYGISTVFSINPFLSFWGSLERMGGLFSFVHYFAYFLILYSVFKTRDEWLRLLKVMIFVGVLSALYGFGQKTNISFFIGGGERARIFGTIGNAALFAGYQIVNLFMALALAISDWVPSKQKSFLFFAVLINLIAVLMTAVRGSLLAVGVSLLLFGILSVLIFKSLWAKKLLTVLAILFVAFVAFAFLFKNSALVKNSGYLKRVTDLSFNAYTVKTRFWAWRAGLEGWKETPKTIILGWGPENFNIPFSKHFYPYFFNGIGSETLFDRAHNMFVEVLVTMGLLAFVIYVSMFIIAFRLLWARIKKEQIDKAVGIGLIALIAAYMIHNSFIFDTSANFLVFFTVLGFIAWLTPRSSEMNLPQKTENKPALNLQNANYKLGMRGQTALLALLIGSIILIYKTDVLPSEANYATTRAILLSWDSKADAAIAKYKESLAFGGLGKYDYRNKYAQYILETFSGKKIGEKEKAILEDAISEEKKNALESKNDYLPYLYLSRLNIILGKDNPSSPYNDEALKNSMQALQYSPTFVRTYYEIAQAYLNKKDLDNAIVYFKRAAELNPDVGLSYWYLAAAYFEKGDMVNGVAAAGNARKDGYGLSESDLARLMGYYIKANDYSNIAETYKTLIKIKPQNPQYHASLAATYVKLNKIDEAVAEARIAAQLDKSFEAEARKFVQSLGREW